MTLFYNVFIWEFLVIIFFLGHFLPLIKDCLWSDFSTVYQPFLRVLCTTVVVISNTFIFNFSVILWWYINNLLSLNCLLFYWTLSESYVLSILTMWQYITTTFTFWNLYSNRDRILQLGPWVVVRRRSIIGSLCFCIEVCLWI